METDKFFCELLTCLPETLFELLGLPGELARDYQFGALELKKLLRGDGAYLPLKPNLPAYVVEFQFYPLETFYANLFAKLFVLLNDNAWLSEWNTVAIFGSRDFEPKNLTMYEDLLGSKRVKRIFLDEWRMPEHASPGLMLLGMVKAPEASLPSLVARVKQGAETEIADKATARKVIELMEELLIRRFATMNREEIRKMFQLTDIRKTAVWKEAHEEGREEGRVDNQLDLVRSWLTRGKTVKQIAEILDITITQARQLAKKAQKLRR